MKVPVFLPENFLYTIVRKVRNNNIFNKFKLRESYFLWY